MGTYMKYLVLLATVSMVLSCGRSADQQQESAPPATVHSAREEAELASITLSPQAELRLGIQTAPAEYRQVQRTRMLGGEVMVVPGGSVTVSAPMSGTVLLPEDGSIPKAGIAVIKDQPLCRILPALPEKDLLGAREEVALREVQLELAQTRARRAQQMLDDRAGSVKQHEEAQADLSRADVALRVARAQLELLERGESDSVSSVLASLVITSPVDGIVQNVHTAAGQTVTGATPLLDIVDMDPVWIRVPVYTGDLATVDTEKAALVHSLSDLTGSATHTANPVPAPLTANPQSVTADIFFSLPNADATFRPGEKVSVILFLQEAEERLVVPYAAIMYDMYGGAWVYANTAPHIFVRQRVELDYVIGDLAVLSHGPPQGTRVVSTGAAELFGTEFGVGK